MIAWRESWPRLPLADDVGLVLAALRARRDVPRRLFGRRAWLETEPRLRPKLSDYPMAAEIAGVHPRWLRAICLIETAEQAKTPAGTPEIWIEAGWWRAIEPGRAAALKILAPLNPEDLVRRWGNFEMLLTLSPAAAISATHFGCARLPGAHHDLCGFQEAGLFLEAMKAGPDAQLRALARFIAHPDCERLRAAMLRDDVEEAALHWGGRRGYVKALGAALEFVGP